MHRDVSVGRRITLWNLDRPDLNAGREKRQECESEAKKLAGRSKGPNVDGRKGLERISKQHQTQRGKEWERVKNDPKVGAG